MIIDNGNRSCGIFNAPVSFFLSFILFVFMLGIVTETVQAKQPDILGGDEWKFFKGDKKPKFKWNHIGFDDSKWLKKKSGFGYGNRNLLKTDLRDMKGKYDTIFVRREFTIDDPDAIKGILLTIDCDGGFIAYLNGIEVIRNKVRMYEDLDISGFIHELLPGTNVLSIQVFNDKIDSEAFTFIPTLKFIEE